MALTSATRNGLFDGTPLASMAVYASLHTQDPDPGSGDHEVTGGSYARISIPWAAASGGTKSSSSQMTFQIPAGTTFTHYGMWSAASGGTYAGGGALTEQQIYSTDGTFKLSITIPSA